MTLKPGDRVRYYLNYRAKGVAARPGGWARAWRRGTVKQVNRVTVDVHTGAGRLERVALERVERVEE